MPGVLGSLSNMLSIKPLPSLPLVKNSVVAFFAAPAFSFMYMKPSPMALLNFSVTDDPVRPSTDPDMASNILPRFSDFSIFPNTSVLIDSACVFSVSMVALKPTSNFVLSPCTFICLSAVLSPAPASLTVALRNSSAPSKPNLPASAKLLAKSVPIIFDAFMVLLTKSLLLSEPAFICFMNSIICGFATWNACDTGNVATPNCVISFMTKANPGAISSMTAVAAVVASLPFLFNCINEAWNVPSTAS